MSSSPAPAISVAGAGGVGLGYGIAIAVGILIFSSTIMLASYLCVRAKSGAVNAGRLHEPPGATNMGPTAVVVLGLDGPTIEALYPKFLHGGSGIVGPCPICLGEYVAGDTLRRGPGCGHCFHAGCAERWLRVSATCPMCRNSPVPSPAATPLATPLAEVVPLAAHAR